MIPQAAITAWRNIAPWASPDQVEHDLVLSRAICELYSNDVIVKSLIFRGGTALHKLFFDKAGRFSEDLDFVQAKAEPIGNTVDAIRKCLDHWLGKPIWKQGEGRFTLSYRFQTEVEPVVMRKVKIEINTREHFNVESHILKKFHIKNSWFEGNCDVLTYSIEELLATKPKALYQRKKGRDLYDFWYVIRQMNVLDTNKIVDIFHSYMKMDNLTVSRAEFEKNLFLKRNNMVFAKDMGALLSANQAVDYKFEQAYEWVLQHFVEKLKGSPWKGAEI